MSQSYFTWPPSSASISGGATAANQVLEIADLDAIKASAASIDTKTPALGQALAAGSVPIVLTAAQLTTLTPYTGGLTDAQLRASPVPVSGTITTGGLTDAQLRASAVPVSLSSTTITGTVAATQSGTWNITNVSGTVSLPTGAATETTLAAINTKVPALGQALAAASVPVVLTAAQLTTLTPLTSVAVTNTGTFAVQATLSAETTKVIGTVNVAAAQTIAVTNAGTFAAQATLAAETTKVIGTVNPGNTANTTAWLVTQASAATSTLTNVASSASTGTILASNSARKGAMIVNDSTASLYLKFGATASVTSYTVLIPPSGYYEFPANPCIYSGIVDGIWSAANGNARVTEIS